MASVGPTDLWHVVQGTQYGKGPNDVTDPDIGAICVQQLLFKTLITTVSIDDVPIAYYSRCRMERKLATFR